MDTAGKRDGTVVTLLTEEQLRSILKDAIREVIAADRCEGYLDTEQAAQYLGTTARAIQAAVYRGRLVPDHRGSRGGGLQGNRFSRSTLDAFLQRRSG